MSHENRLRRLEVLTTVNQLQKAEMMTVIMQVMTCPGQYTSMQVARAFDRLLGKHNGETMAAIEYLEREYPIVEDDSKVRDELRKMGIQIPEDEEVQLDLPFEELNDIDTRKKAKDFDLFGEDDDDDELNFG